MYTYSADLGSQNQIILLRADVGNNKGNKKKTFNFQVLFL